MKRLTMIAVAQGSPQQPRQTPKRLDGISPPLKLPYPILFVGFLILNSSKESMGGPATVGFDRAR